MFGHLRDLLRDLPRIGGGFVTLFRSLLTEDPADLSLGQLSAESRIAVRGRSNRYAVMISSARTRPEEVTLIVDIHTIDSPAHSDGHYAHFWKRLKARPRAVTHVEVRYDWRSGAGFVVDGTPSPADDCWRGTVDRHTRYAVSAALLDSRGKHLERLTVYQELAP